MQGLRHLLICSLLQWFLSMVPHMVLWAPVSSDSENRGKSSPSALQCGILTQAPGKVGKAKNLGHKEKPVDFLWYRNQTVILSKVK